MAKAAKKDPYAKRLGESSLEYQSRITRMEQEQRDKGTSILTPEAEKHGDYIDKFVHHAETGTKTRVKMNKGGSSIERWLSGPTFENSEQKAIRHCQGLWAIIDGHSRAMEFIDGGEGRREHEALTELSGYKKKVPAKYWSVFENVARHHIDAARAGLGLANNGRSARDAARTCTAFCAGMVAIWNGY
jgi:hypothetical protein